MSLSDSSDGISDEMEAGDVLESETSEKVEGGGECFREPIKRTSVVLIPPAAREAMKNLLRIEQYNTSKSTATNEIKTVHLNKHAPVKPICTLPSHFGDVWREDYDDETDDEYGYNEDTVDNTLKLRRCGMYEAVPFNGELPEHLLKDESDALAKMYYEQYKQHASLARNKGMNSHEFGYGIDIENEITGARSSKHGNVVGFRRQIYENIGHFEDANYRPQPRSRFSSPRLSDPNPFVEVSELTPRNRQSISNACPPRASRSTVIASILTDKDGKLMTGPLAVARLKEHQTSTKMFPFRRDVDRPPQSTQQRRTISVHNLIPSGDDGSQNHSSFECEQKCLERKSSLPTLSLSTKNNSKCPSDVRFTVSVLKRNPTLKSPKQSDQRDEFYSKPESKLKKVSGTKPVHSSLNRNNSLPNGLGLGNTGKRNSPVHRKTGQTSKKQFEVDFKSPRSLTNMSINRESEITPFENEKFNSLLMNMMFEENAAEVGPDEKRIMTKKLKHPGIPLQYPKNH